jgi:putative nucleotidyltransferase with HDIG domain
MSSRTSTERFLLSYYPGTLQDLPVLSPVAIRAARDSEVGSLDLDKLVEAIGSDIFLSAKVVSVANSIYFNQTHTPCYTVRAAVARVGLEYSEALLRNSEKIDKPTEQEAVVRLWSHCLRTALVAKRLAEFSFALPVPADAVYWIALIHDIGILIAATFQRTALASVTRSYLDGERDHEEHSTLGHSLAHYWSLPGIVKDVIRWHHVPGKCCGPAAQALAALVQLAENAIEGRHIFGTEDRRVEELLDLAGINRAYLKKISQECSDLVHEVIADGAFASATDGCGTLSTVRW